MKKTVLVSMLSLAALVPVLAQAADGTVNFNGEVVGQTCVINGGTPNLSVTLPKVSTSALATAGATAGTSPNVIFNLTACSAGNVRAFFEAGPNVDQTTGRLKIATGSGQATNVQIGLLNTDGTKVTMGAASGAQGTTYVPISGGAATLTYMSQYVATAAATSGKTTTSVTYSIEYQ